MTLCALSMNHLPSGELWQENHVVFFCEFLQQMLFSLSNFFFVLLESFFHIGDAMNHEAPEQFGQLTGQCQIGP